MAQLLNVDNRVHGYFVNWEEVFFFEGDTASLNSFIEKFSALPDTELVVVIHPGRLAVCSPWDKEPREVAADWQLYVSPLMPDEVQAEGVQPGAFVTRINVWLGGSVKLNELHVPESVAVRSGGEIEAFVKEHNAARSNGSHIE